MLDRLNEVEKEVQSVRISNKSELKITGLNIFPGRELFPGFFDELKDVDKSEKPVIGKKLNDLKKMAESLFEFEK